MFVIQIGNAGYVMRTICPPIVVQVVFVKIQIYGATDSLNYPEVCVFERVCLWKIETPFVQKSAKLPKQKMMGHNILKEVFAGD